MSRAAGAIGFAALVLAFRYLTVGALENDHFVHLARAHQLLLHGAWPVRDFVDPGMPLQYLGAAAAAWLLGPSLLSDVVLNATLLAAAAAVTFLLAHRASRSLPIAMVATALQIASRPRLYNAPKIFVLVMAIALGWWYADRPTIRRLSLLAVWTTVAFLVRHDYGLYVGVATLLLIALSVERNPLAIARHVGTYAAIMLASALPWLAYVEWAQSLRAYVISAVAFSRAEALRTADGLPGLAFGLLLLLPIGVAILARRRQGLDVPFAHVAFACGLLFLVEIAFLRDVLAARLPDVSGPGAIVVACLLGLTLPSGWRARLSVVAAAVILGGTLLSMRARTREQISMDEAWRRPAVVTDRLTRWPWTPVVPSPELVPLAVYVERCTTTTDRVLAGWFAPEFAVIARRAFAGGHPSWLPGYYDSDADQDRTIARLATEPVPVLLLDDAFAGAWPRVYRSLMLRPYERAKQVTIQGRRIDVLVDSSRPASRVDSETELPCFSTYPEHASTGSAGYRAKRGSTNDNSHK